jgi:magnesium transporter
MLAVPARTLGAAVQLRDKQTDPAASATGALSGALWIDALSPTAEEVQAIVSATGLAPPTESSLVEIETSSRLADRDGVLYLSVPLAYRASDGGVVSSPLGFVLTEERLLTVHFDRIPMLDAYAETLRQRREPPRSSWHVLVGVLEQIVDSLADMLERSRADLDAVSRRIFAESAEPVRGGAELRDLLQTVGRAGEDVSAIRDTLLVLGRLVAFVARSDRVKSAHDLDRRIRTVRADIASLSDYDAHVAQKVQFLLDAILGLINIAQSNIIKLMTVVGVVGVPPTLIASIYGMNFEVMPELHFRYGYPMALLAIVASAVLPVIWFKRRGWL